jgi:putative transposase
MKKTRQEAPVSDELMDAWLKQGRTPEDVNGLVKQITKRLVERAMQGEMAEHLG